MIERYQTRTLLAWLLLLTFLLSCARGALGLPVLLLIMGNSHKVFLTHTHDEIHLVLQHPGNPDEHDRAVGDHSGHEHHWLDNVLALFTTEQDRHPDHEIHLSDYELEVTVATRTVEVSKTFLSLAISQVPPVFAEPVSVALLPHPPPEANPTLICHSTTVLLI